MLQPLRGWSYNGKNPVVSPLRGLTTGYELGIPSGCDRFGNYAGGVACCAGSTTGYSSVQAFGLLLTAALRVTPAMEADVDDHVWSLEEVVALLD
jgi:hypothetical protein